MTEARGAKMIWVPVGEKEFKGLPTKSYISRETYFRLLAADYLPESLDRILWLDADMVIDGDLSAFYHTDLTGYSVAACPHGAVMKGTMLENCERIGIEYPEQYFNAGVMLCNLQMWREMGILDRIQQILSVPRQMKFPGQDLTNLLFNGTVKTEDWRIYNCMTHSVLPEELPQLQKMAKIIHYAGTAKPWRFNDLPFADTWMKYYKRTAYGSRPLTRTSYFRMKAMYQKLHDYALKQSEDK